MLLFFIESSYCEAARASEECSGVHHTGDPPEYDGRRSTEEEEKSSSNLRCSEEI